MLNFLEDIKMNVLQKLLYWGFNGNSWCWFHILAGGLIAKFCGFWTVVVLAFGWEIIEFFLESGGSLENCKKTYGSVERWVYDSIGDIIGAIICAAIVVF